MVEHTWFSNGKAGRAVVAFGILVLGMLWALIISDIQIEKNREELTARTEAANLARVLSEQVSHTIQSLDQALIYLAAEYRRAPKDFDLSRSVVAGVVPSQISLQIARIDALGWLVESSLPNTRRMDLSDREHFRVHLGHDRDHLFISKPLLGRASGKWSIQLSRRITNAAGQFDGVLVLSLDPSYLSSLFSDIQLGSHGLITLVGKDGVVRAASDHGIGRVMPDADLLSTLFQVKSGAVERLVSWDGEERLVAGRIVPQQPLSVLVAPALADVKADVQGLTQRYLAVGGAVSLILVCALAALYRMVRTQERTARDLAVKKSELMTSRERLRRYVLDLERIAEVAAHDLQEPLRRVVAYAQLLSKHAEAALDQESRDYVAHVVAGAQRMRKLVKDLEAFVAVDHLTVGDVEADAADALAGALVRVSDDVARTGATISAEGLPRVVADGKSLEEVFWQLVDNALRYRHPDRRPVIHVSARIEAAQAIFSVSDNGLGIDERHLPRIFEIFHRLHGIDQRSGTGMGLAIVRRIVEHLGGRVWVDSQTGEGSTFSFSLPLADRALVDYEVRAA